MMRTKATIRSTKTFQNPNHMKTKHHSILSPPVIQSGDKALIRRRWFALALGGFLFTSIFAFSAPPVEAQCSQWNVGHGWRFKQGSTNVDLELDQNGTVITGKANHRIDVTPKDGGPGIEGKANVRGTVDGTMKDDHFDVIIHWNNNTTGVYNGTIGPSGRIEGTGYNQATPSIKVNWYSETHMECADAAPVEPPTATPPIKSSGKMPKTQSSTASPTISAHPTVVNIPDGQSEGTVTLTWDGGPDHPDAKVWMKEGSQGEEKRVAEDGKGTRRVTVERGKNYLFFLTDAGEQLAKAVVISRQ